MRQRECTRCRVVKDDSEFSFQATKPIFKYSWCDPCREENKNSKTTFQTTLTPRQKAAYRAELNELRDKAKDLRKFSPEQCVNLKARLDKGAKAKDLAKEFNTSPSTIYRASRGYRS